MIITVANWKGGVGKSTLAVAIADAFIAERGQSVSLVDLDPQATTSQILLGKEDFTAHQRTHKNLYGLLKRRLESIRPKVASTAKAGKPSEKPFTDYRTEPLNFVKTSTEANLRLYPNGPLLWELEDEELGKDGAQGLMKVINKVLTEEAARQRIVIVDCPPGHSMSTLAAIRSSDMVLCPMTLDSFAFWGMDLFSAYIERRARREIQRRFVVTRYVRGEGKEFYKALREGREMLLLGGHDPAIFSERKVVSNAMQERAKANRADRRKLKELHRIYGSECGDQLRKIVNAIALEGFTPA